jgi:hypothetical protein
MKVLLRINYLEKCRNWEKAARLSRACPQLKEFPVGR